MRELVHARLVEKTLLSAAAQCYHLTFAWAAEHALMYEPGQFLSLVANDPTGKSYTRAYSLACAPNGSGFDLCVNRVEGGFFSNFLCDMGVGSTTACHGPHGLFTLRPPMAELLWIAGGTGIAPMRAFAQHLFPLAGQPLFERCRVTLVYEALAEDQWFYDTELLALAARHRRFVYLPVIGEGTDRRGLKEALDRLAFPLVVATSRPLNGEQAQDSSSGAMTGARAYVCGLAALVRPARAQLLAAGWEKQQILFERYD